MLLQFSRTRSVAVGIGVARRLHGSQAHACKHSHSLYQESRRSLLEMWRAGKVVTGTRWRGKVVVASFGRLTQQHIAHGIAIAPSPFTACCVSGCDRGSRHRDRIAASNRHWIRCLRLMRVAGRRGQTVGNSTLSGRAILRGRERGLPGTRSPQNAARRWNIHRAGTDGAAGCVQ